MKGKIGLEEHFAIDDTLIDSKGFFPDDIWLEVRERILDLHGRRLRLMDEFGMEMMILSLNAPAIQAIPDAEEGQRDRAQGQRLSRRAGEEAPRPLPGARRAAAAGSRSRRARAAALREGPRHGRRAGQRLLADRRSEHDRLSRREAVLAVLGRVRQARRAVLSAPAQPAAAGLRASTRTTAGCWARPGRSARRPRCMRCA